MKKLLSVFLVTLLAVTALTCLMDITASAATYGNLTYTVSNGDAEDGLANWSTIHGGSIALVQPGADGTANAVKLTPTGKYNSFAFDIGPAIIKDEEYGYNGGGAGNYEITFWAKGDRSGSFNMMIESRLYLGDSQIAQYYPELDCGKATYLRLDKVELTTQWKQYRFLISIEQDWLDLLKGLRNSDHTNADTAYELGLALDGAYSAFKDDYFSYYVDQVTVEKSDEMIKVPVGINVEAIENVEGSTYFKSNTGIVKNDVVSGNITKDFTIRNNGTEMLKIRYSLQATVIIDGRAMWEDPWDPDYVEIGAGEIWNLSYSMQVNEDNTVTVEGVDVPVENFFARFDMLNSEGVLSFKKGTSITIFGKDEALLKLSTNSTSRWKISEHLGYDLEGRVEKDGNWYYYFLGEMLMDTWCLDENGYFYLDENGILVMDYWFFDGEDWGYVNSDGYLAMDAWVKDSVGWCYLTEDGTMATNEWILDSVGWCYVGSDGYCVTNTWKQDSVGWCYLNSEGRMATNTWILDSVGWCYVGSDGYCVTNRWMADSVGWVYLDSEGRMKTNAWVMDSVGWCYVGSDGYAVTNCWKSDSSGWCYLDANGRMVTNCYVYDSNGKCWLDANGYWDGKYV